MCVRLSVGRDLEVFGVTLARKVCKCNFGGHFCTCELTSCANLATVPQNQAPQISGRKSTCKMTSRTEGMRIRGPHAPLTSQKPVGRAGAQRPKHVGRLGTDPRTPHGVLAAAQGAGGQWPYLMQFSYTASNHSARHVARNVSGRVVRRRI